MIVMVFMQFPVRAQTQIFNGYSRNRLKDDFQFKPAQGTIFTIAAAATSPAAVFSNTSSISITDRAGINGANGIAAPYPSTIAVSGLTGTLNGITVTLTNVSLPRTRDIDIVLVAPDGKAFMLMSDVSDDSATTGANITISDAGSAFPAAGAVATGTYLPTDVVSALTANDSFPAPAPSAYNSPAPTGTATFASVYNGINPNGTWSLYIEDDALGGGNSTIAGGWSLNITTAGGAATSTTNITSSINPSLTTQSVTFTAAVSSGGSAVTSGTVSFTQNGAAISGCTNVALNAGGQAVCTAGAGTLPEGTRTIAANYSGTTLFGASSGSLSQTINSPTIVSGSQFCNNGGINVNDNGTAFQYPSNISVSGLIGTISKVTVDLNNVTLPRAQDIDLLLVGPGGQALIIASDIGSSGAASNVNLTLDDAAASTLPIGASLTGGTFRPTDNDVPGAPDVFPAPAPSSFNQPAPNRTATFASVYNGSNPNGTWNLYAVDDALGGGASSIGGYCLNFALNKFSTTTIIDSSRNPSPAMQSVTFTATVTTSGADIPSGSVEFFDGMTSLGTRTLDVSGKAMLTTSALAQGTHNITANYLGANVGAGGGGFAPSPSAALSQSVLPPTAAPVNIDGRVISSTGRGVPRATVTIIDGSGNTRTARTNPFGYYRFSAVEVGQSYVITVSAKNRSFAALAVTLFQEMNNLNFAEIQ